MSHKVGRLREVFAGCVSVLRGERRKRGEKRGGRGERRREEERRRGKRRRRREQEDTGARGRGRENGRGISSIQEV